MPGAAIPKTFWSSPIRYLRWASHEKPAIFYSIIIGSMGPVCLVAIPPMRRYAGDEDPPPIPLTYPSEFCLPPPSLLSSCFRYIPHLPRVVVDILLPVNPPFLPALFPFTLPPATFLSRSPRPLGSLADGFASYSSVGIL